MEKAIFLVVARIPLSIQAAPDNVVSLRSVGGEEHEKLLKVKPGFA
jgi:hypothetical protein